MDFSLNFMIDSPDVLVTTAAFMNGPAFMHGNQITSSQQLAPATGLLGEHCFPEIETVIEPQIATNATYHPSFP